MIPSISAAWRSSIDNLRLSWGRILLIFLELAQYFEINGHYLLDEILHLALVMLKLVDVYEAFSL